MTLKQVAVPVLLGVLLVAAGCSSPKTEVSVSRPLVKQQEIFSTSEVEVAEDDIECGAPIKLAKGWRPKGNSENGAWIISESGEISVYRPEDDFANVKKRLVGEIATYKDSKAYKIAGPFETTLFGQPAIACSIVGEDLQKFDPVLPEGFTRLFVGSADWIVDASSYTAYDTKLASDLKAMCGSQFPKP